MQVIDLSHTLHTGMPVYPGSKQARLVKTADFETKGFQETYLYMSSHTGTHIDCGQHLLRNSFNTADSSPDRFVGNGMVIDCRGCNVNYDIPVSLIQPEEERIKQADFVLLLTGWNRLWGTDRYFSSFPVPGTATARYLAGFNLKGMGIDGPSFDVVESHDYPVHKLFMSHGILLIENLTNLELLLNRDFLFSCYPLKIKEGDGSPVRAVGVVISDE